MTTLMITGGQARIAAMGALALAAITLAAGVGTAGSAAGTGGPTLRCEIRQSLSHGQILLEPMVIAGAATSGSYSMTLSGGGAGGSSSIRQGGDFDATPGRATSLGQISVGASSASYRARLEVTAGGRSAACASQVDGAL